MYFTVNCATRFYFFLAVYPLRYAIHLGSLGCLEEARVAVVLCCPKVMKLPQVDAIGFTSYVVCFW